ncbi:MAG: YbjN domain-containing protein [Angustibacter sp.]
MTAAAWAQPGADPAAVRRLVHDHLAACEIPAEPGGRPGEVVVILPGERKLRTTVSLLIGDHSLSASAFVIRRPQQAADAVHQWLLRRNARLGGVAFALDQAGDVYLVARLPLAAVTAASLDALLGALLDAADRAFDPLLALGFRDAMQREWDWRVSRGEPTSNLEAFRHLLHP